jgi:hypothetical protein
MVREKEAVAFIYPFSLHSGMAGYIGLQRTKQFLLCLKTGWFAKNPLVIERGSGRILMKVF